MYLIPKFLLIVKIWKQSLIMILIQLFNSAKISATVKYDKNMLVQLKPYCVSRITFY